MLLLLQWCFWFIGHFRDQILQIIEDVKGQRVFHSIHSGQHLTTIMFFYFWLFPYFFLPLALAHCPTEQYRHWSYLVPAVVLSQCLRRNTSPGKQKHSPNRRATSRWVEHQYQCYYKRTVLCAVQAKQKTGMWKQFENFAPPVKKKERTHFVVELGPGYRPVHLVHFNTVQFSTVQYSSV